LSEGSTLVLSHDPQRLGVDPAEPLEVTVTGTFAPHRGDQETWDRDVLDAVGYSPSFDGPPMYGPLVVAPGVLLGRLPVERISLVIDPDLTSVDPTTALSLRAEVAGVRDSLDEVLGDRAR